MTGPRAENYSNNAAPEIDAYLSHQAYARAYRHAEQDLRALWPTTFAGLLTKALALEPDYHPSSRGRKIGSKVRKTNQGG